ncbi:iron ABC transporter permease [Glaciihabitans arcticus]|uniref:Iron ABC transporter permease n=1 Tax=Glaciihabitans arcticus TaxID=2668039 RepID=A0A4Q9GPQ7_9MICO|nr:iron chelate uptake ABC transporter family permease subunit [Glaciihabitans arcticus]TBN56832.1 iron ABC transporter permease [Glaciihabitans arcticus]
MTVVSAARTVRRSRARLVIAVLLLCVLAVAAVSLAVGAYTVSIPDLLATLVGQGGAKNEFIVLRLRLPRMTMAVLAGLAFGLAGALFQSLLGNPLASPDLIGITSGASVSAVFAILVLGLSGFAVSGFAFVGALVVATAIYLLSWRSGIAGYRFVLVGIGIAFMAQAALGYLLTRADVRDAQGALVWMVGSLSGTQWIEVAVAAISIGVLVPAVSLLAPKLRMLQLGDETARGLGVRVDLSRVLLLGVAVALAASATAAVGPIAFVAFVSGPIARRLVPGTSLVPSALIGILLVLTADFASQHLLPGGVQVPVGIITGAIGAPYLLWLLASSRSRTEA